MPSITPLHLQLFSILLAAAVAAKPQLSAAIPSDAVSLLSFKSGADLNHKLFFSLTERFDYCQWRGVKCGQGRVVRLVLQGAGLRGTFKPDTLSRLDQLRVLSLHNNSLSGPVPDLSGLFNLKSLFLGHNRFSGSFPASILSLHRLRLLDLSSDDFSGPIPGQITGLDRLDTLRLELNRFTGPLPPLNQTSLKTFNVSGNNLTGSVPITPTLSRFGPTSFAGNPGLCGETVNRACAEPFFGGGSRNNNESSTSIPAPLGQSAQSQGAVVVGLSPPAATPLKKPGRTGVILGFTIGVFLLIAGVLLVFSLVRARGGSNGEVNPKEPTELAAATATEPPPGAVPIDKSIEAIPKTEELAPRRVQRSGFLVFCSGEAELYTLEQLMRASAELLGRGMVGTTYKAVLDNQLVVTVKRLDSSKTAAVEEERFERHMEAVGGLRHPNIVPVRAYFQANGERLIVFDYQPNGSLYNLIHGSRSARAKPLHWTSCLKIAEDVAQGLSYIHQASRLIHGNLKSSNILLGTDFEACLTDYSLSLLLTDDSPNFDDPDSSAYRAPEARTSARRATPKSDVYTFGVLVLELLTGKHPSQQPFLEPVELLEWVRAVRADDDGPGEDRRLEMMVEVAGVCRLSSPEQRPGMWQVLKMIHEIKESAGEEENNGDEVD